MTSGSLLQKRHACHNLSSRTDQPTTSPKSSGRVNSSGSFRRHPAAFLNRFTKNTNDREALLHYYTVTETEKHRSAIPSLNLTRGDGSMRKACYRLFIFLFPKEAK